MKLQDTKVLMRAHWETSQAGFYVMKNANDGYGAHGAKRQAQKPITDGLPGRVQWSLNRRIPAHCLQAPLWPSE